MHLFYFVHFTEGDCLCLANLFQDGCIVNNLGRHQTVSLGSKQQVCLQPWKIRIVYLSQGTDMLTAHYKIVKLSKVKLSKVLSIIQPMECASFTWSPKWALRLRKQVQVVWLLLLL